MRKDSNRNKRQFHFTNDGLKWYDEALINARILNTTVSKMVEEAILSKSKYPNNLEEIFDKSEKTREDVVYLLSWRRHLNKWFKEIGFNDEIHLALASYEEPVKNKGLLNYI